MGVLDAAQGHGIKVAWHLEPYSGRSGPSTVADVSYINNRYGSHPAFYRSARHGGKAVFYAFESLNVADWSALSQVTGSNIVLAQTTDTSRIAGFSGMYTYDAIAGATAPRVGQRQRVRQGEQPHLVTVDRPRPHRRSRRAGQHHADAQP